jgi:Cyclin-dependent kinase inhibitor 3 (CDKN3)
MKSWTHSNGALSTAAALNATRVLFTLGSWASTHALDATLLHKAASVRKKLPENLQTSDELFFPSAYAVNIDGGRGVTPATRTHMRGFCNWIIPGRIMVGQYPGENPEASGPTADDVQSHLTTTIRDAGVNLFCSLQSEIPPQDDYESWNRGNGRIYLQDTSSRRQFPKSFSHYAPLARSIINGDACQFLHWPIDDLSVPSNSKSLQTLLLKLLTAIEDDDRSVYIHCWGGRGRAGLTACCLLSLLYPELDAMAILDLVQAGYDTRLGAKEMPLGLSKSPQTDSQRMFVREFIKERRAAAQTHPVTE